MKIGTKSILFGVHQFVLHPLFTALAWYKLFGFPKDIRIWIAFFVHDLGYLGKENMEGLNEGESHPILGAKIMSIFGRKWYGFVLYHSGFYAKKYDKKISRLCIADKYSIVLVPTWLYVFLGRLSGEIYEYRHNKKYKKQVGLHTLNDYGWFDAIKTIIHAWVKKKKKNRDWYDF